MQNTKWGCCTERVEYKVPQLFTAAGTRFQIFCLEVRKKETLHPCLFPLPWPALFYWCSSQTAQIWDIRRATGCLTSWLMDGRQEAGTYRKKRKDEENKAQYSGWKFWLFHWSKTAVKQLFETTSTNKTRTFCRRLRTRYFEVNRDLFWTKWILCLKLTRP